ncbi:hypothetical protein GCM10023093_13730 [Nemorincola caseinilytica]|uniref:Carboxypeptidase-like regulatory domain-containing protein n=1 Tax=Nemorincola caseinilytica TaxID=2054315 RepID=A0ABP8NAN7_9BACT
MVDDKHNGIPFAVIEARERHEGVYTDANGYFAFSGDTAIIRTLAVFCMGYEEQVLHTATLPADSLTIQLRPKATTLRAVQVKPREGKVRNGILGRSKRKLSKDGDLFRKYGAETAILLTADTGQYDATLRDVYVYITGEGAPTSYFRVHVYEYDSLPGREVTDSNVVVHARKGNSWVRVDLRSKYIPVGKGLFVSVEWVSGFGNTMSALASEQHAEVVGFNGQVVGITADYGKPSCTYSRAPFSDQWEYYDDPAAQRKGGYFLNPMIYCTYTYIK